ncbi:MAG: hypothetical protein V4801_25775 [Burkholderia gladioli]
MLRDRLVIAHSLAPAHGVEGRGRRGFSHSGQGRARARVASVKSIDSRRLRAYLFFDGSIRENINPIGRKALEMLNFWTWINKSAIKRTIANGARP